MESFENNNFCLQESAFLGAGVEIRPEDKSQSPGFGKPIHTSRNYVFLLKPVNEPVNWFPSLFYDEGQFGSGWPARRVSTACGFMCLHV